MWIAWHGPFQLGRNLYWNHLLWVAHSYLFIKFIYKNRCLCNSSIDYAMMRNSVVVKRIFSIFGNQCCALISSRRHYRRQLSWIMVCKVLGLAKVSHLVVKVWRLRIRSNLSKQSKPQTKRQSGGPLNWSPSFCRIRERTQPKPSQSEGGCSIIIIIMILKLTIGFPSFCF